MAQLPDEVFDNSLVSLKRALGITTCAMACAEASAITEDRPEIAYALWQVQENLCDAILDLEEEVEYPDYADLALSARHIAFYEAATLVERFSDSPVVVPPNESFASVIAKAIRQLATN